MSVSFIRDQDLRAWVAAMLDSAPVYGPVARRSHFAFARLCTPEDLRLDYDVTLLPPKKLFFPPSQDLLRFEGSELSACVQPEEKILLGVHFYDVKAIDQTDQLFSERHFDINYMAHRQATTLVMSSVQRVAARAFFGTVGQGVAPRGHDAALTRISSGYVLETFTERGEKLLTMGEFTRASKAQSAAARQANEAVLDRCPEKLEHATTAIAEQVRAAFGDEELWERLAEDCFSCGSCNTVCPTCYCFDVQDTWNVDQRSGQRTRTWDACLTEDFAKISLGAGAAENFREHRHERFRHRIMRKTTYLSAKLGGPACVGCGRCSAACTADIADPVRVINQILAS